MQEFEPGEQQGRQHRQRDHKPRDQAVQPCEGYRRDEREQRPVQHDRARPVESSVRVRGVSREYKQAGGENRHAYGDAGVENGLPPDRLGQITTPECRRELTGAHGRQRYAQCGATPLRTERPDDERRSCGEQDGRPDSLQDAERDHGPE